MHFEFETPKLPDKLLEFSVAINPGMFLILPKEDKQVYWVPLKLKSLLIFEKAVPDRGESWKEEQEQHKPQFKMLFLFVPLLDLESPLFSLVSYSF